MTPRRTWAPQAIGGWPAQVPFALVTLAVAAAVGLPRPWAGQASAVAAGLAALAAPAALHLPWWSPIALSGAGATAIGLAAAASRDARTAWARAAVASVLFADTIGASLVRPDVTTRTLLGSALINAVVAAVATRTRRRLEGAAGLDVPPKHLVVIGGGALAGGVLALAGGVGVAAAARPAPLSIVLTAALAGLCLGLAVVSVACYNDEVPLPYATATIATGGTLLAVGTLQTTLPTEVYAAAAALLVVLAELLRAAVTARRAVLSGAGLRAAGTPARPRRRVPFVGDHPGYPLMLAAAPATTLTVVWVAPALAASLAGPYRALGSVWSGAPGTVVDSLGPLGGWAGDGATVLAGVLLTLAAALGAVGFGGDAGVVAGRAVAVVIPGAALTLLVTPAALDLRWPAGPLSAMLVAALCGLGVALTRPPRDTVAANPVRAARRVVLVICALAAGAGLAGSLASKPMTLAALGIAVVAGLTAAIRGRSRPAHTVGWLVTLTSSHLFALVAALIAGLPADQAAFCVGAVAGGLLILAALLPRLRRPSAASESVLVEAGAYAGGVLALLLAARSLPYLAGFATAWGAVLGVAAARPGRQHWYRSTLIWVAAAHEVVAWWLLMRIGHVAVPEAYTLAVALVAVITGYVETRRHPEISSWAAYGVALVAGFLPSLTLVLLTGQTPLRRALLIIAAAAVVAWGSLRGQQAPVVVASVALTIATLHELAVLSTAALLWAVTALVGAVLVGLGANYERRRQRIAKVRRALGRLR